MNSDCALVHLCSLSCPGEWTTVDMANVLPLQNMVRFALAWYWCWLDHYISHLQPEAKLVRLLHALLCEWRVVRSLHGTCSFQKYYITCGLAVRCAYSGGGNPALVSQICSLAVSSDVYLAGCNSVLLCLRVIGSPFTLRHSSH